MEIKVKTQSHVYNMQTFLEKTERAMTFHVTNYTKELGLGGTHTLRTGLPYGAREIQEGGGRNGRQPFSIFLFKLPGL